MELWIRSQDKMNLVKVNQVNVDYQNSKRIIANYIPDFVGTQGEYYEMLGDYESKERALEVLDEIQRRLIKLQLVSLEEKGKARKDAVINDNLKCVYEMPEE